MLTKQDVAELLELAEWLELQPNKSAYSGSLPPRLYRWTQVYMERKRAVSKIIYYQSGYGWRLNRQWKSNIYKHTALINQSSAITL